MILNADTFEKKAREIVEKLQKIGVAVPVRLGDGPLAVVATALSEAVREEREACAKIADHAATVMAETALQHDENSESRDRCHARARQARQIAQLIRSRGESNG